MYIHIYIYSYLLNALLIIYIVKNFKTYIFPIYAYLQICTLTLIATLKIINYSPKHTQHTKLHIILNICSNSFVPSS